MLEKCVIIEFIERKKKKLQGKNKELNVKEAVQERIQKHLNYQPRNVILSIKNQKRIFHI